MKGIGLTICIAAFALTACAGNAGDAVATGVAATQQVSQLSTEAALTQVTATPEITLTPTETQQPAPTATPEFYWDGVWDFSVPGSVLNGIAVDHWGYLINSSVYSFGGGPAFTYQGVLNDNQQEARGVIQTSDATTGSAITYEFQLQMVAENHDQFRGSYVAGGVTYEWCGARNGAAFPTPCRWP
jgi:hypothetical protein